MTKLLACVDGSGYADNICGTVAWAARRMGAEVDLLHVLRGHSDYEAPASDHTGAIGVGARHGLLEELTKVDEERGRLDQKTGKLILEHGASVLKEAGIDAVDLHHRRGGLVETILELEVSAEIVFVGKRGEHANVGSPFLGSNLEKVARAVHKPLFVVASKLRPIKKFLIAYDGKNSIQNAVAYIAENPLLKNLGCHLLVVERNAGDVDVKASKEKLRNAGFDVTVETRKSNHVDQEISAYVEDNQIDLLVIGAYSHSRIRRLLLGSTTASLITSCKIPVFLFR